MSKYALLVCFLVSAVVTPSGDIVTQSILAVPMMALYMLGVAVAWVFGKPRRAPEDVAVSVPGAGS